MFPRGTRLTGQRKGGRRGTVKCRHVEGGRFDPGQIKLRRLLREPRGHFRDSGTMVGGGQQHQRPQTGKASIRNQACADSGVQGELAPVNLEEPGFQGKWQYHKGEKFDGDEFRRNLLIPNDGVTSSPPSKSTHSEKTQWP